MSKPVAKRRKLKKRNRQDETENDSSVCLHPAIVGSLCAVCGKKVIEETKKTQKKTYIDENSSNDFQRVTLVGCVSDLKVNKNEALSISSTLQQRLSLKKKLQLVLDIDQTLLECTSKPPPYKLDSIIPITLFNGEQNHWLKLRPGVISFLKAAHEMYELTLYTNGIRDYLLQVSNALDPNHELFGDRLVSTPDDAPDLKAKGGGFKDLHRLFPGSISKCLILDDRDDIWKGAQKDHVLLVQPYRYFHYNSQGEPCFPPGEDGCSQLPCYLKLLTKIHQQYYHGQDSQMEAVSSNSSSTSSSLLPELSCATLLRKERQVILKGCTFCFSGIFPKNGPDLEDDQNEEHREIYWIKKYGGEVNDHIIPNKTTHLIAKSPKTDKVIEAVYHQLHVVHLDWFWFTIWYHHKANEQVFKLKNIPSFEESQNFMKMIDIPPPITSIEKGMLNTFEHDFDDLDKNSEEEEEEEDEPFECFDEEGNEEDEGEL